MKFEMSLQHNMFSFCSGGSCEWEDEDEKNQEQDYSITFLTPSHFSSAFLHPLHHNHLLQLFAGTKKTPSSYFAGPNNSRTNSMSLPGPGWYYLLPLLYFCEVSVLLCLDAPGIVIELWSTNPGPIQINWSVCLFRQIIN